MSLFSQSINLQYFCSLASYLLLILNIICMVRFCLVFLLPAYACLCFQLDAVAVRLLFLLAIVFWDGSSYLGDLFYGKAMWWFHCFYSLRFYLSLVKSEMIGTVKRWITDWFRWPLVMRCWLLVLCFRDLPKWGIGQYGGKVPQCHQQKGGGKQP